MGSKQKLVESMTKNPKNYFDDPGDVANYPGLDRSDRISILRSWKQEIVQLMKASEENMSTEYTYSLEGINKALSHEAPDEV